MSDNNIRSDYLRILLEYYYPLHFFAVFRAHELYNVEPYIELLKPPILDLGCGDGMISNVLFRRRLDFGIDPSKDAVAIAREKKAYSRTFVGDAHNIPLETDSLGGIFSNCALEHIPDIEALIAEVSRVLKPDGYFIATCLSLFYYNLNPVFRLFDRKGTMWLRKRMIRAENALHNNVSVFNVETYDRIFRANEMELVTHKYYGTTEIAKIYSSRDTLSKYIIPYPTFLMHHGIYPRYLRLRYGKVPRSNIVDRWHNKYYQACYRRTESENIGIGQILIARKSK